MQVHISLLGALVSAQCFLIYEMRVMVCPNHVHTTRDMYDKFEAWMYDNHTWVTAYDDRRGVDGFWDETRFHSMPKEDQETICALPFAHPNFAFCILLIWTFTVIVDIRRLSFLVKLLIGRVPTVATVYDIFRHDDDERNGRPIREEGKVIVVGLTLGIKAVLLLFVFVPRLVVNTILLWLGCRWLVATDNLEEVFLNAVALEFVLNLKELIYLAVIPMRNKVETQELLIPMNVEERAGYLSYLGAFGWLVLGILWVYLYLYHLQGVLVDYKWDPLRP